MRVGVLGVVEDIGGRAGFDDATSVEHGDFVGHGGDDADVVGDEHNGGLVFGLEIADEAEDLGLEGDVEGGGGFVGDEQVRAVSKGQGQGDALPFSAAEFEGITGPDPRGIGMEQVSGEFADRRFAAAVDAKELTALPLDGEHRVEAQRGFLQKDGDAAAADLTQPGGGCLQQILRLEADGAIHGAAGGQQTQDGASKRALAATGRAAEPERLSRRHLQREIPDGPTVGAGIAHGEMVDGQHFSQDLYHRRGRGPLCSERTAESANFPKEPTPMKMHNTVLAGLTFAALAVAQPAPFSSTAQLKAACETSPGNVVVINTPVKVFNGPALPAVETVRTGCRLVFGPLGSIEFDNVGMRFNGAFSAQASAKSIFSMKKSLISANSALIDFAAPEGTVVVDESRMLATAGSLTIDLADDAKLQIGKPLAGATNALQASGAINLQGGRKYELAMAETRLDAGTASTSTATVRRRRCRARL